MEIKMVWEGESVKYCIETIEYTCKGLKALRRCLQKQMGIYFYLWIFHHMTWHISVNVLSKLILELVHHCYLEFQVLGAGLYFILNTNKLEGTWHYIRFDLGGHFIYSMWLKKYFLFKFYHFAEIGHMGLYTFLYDNK